MTEKQWYKLPVLKKNQYNSKKKGWRLPASVGTRAHHTGLMPWVWISRPCIQAKCAVSVILVLLRWNGISRLDHLEHHMQHYSKQEGRTFEVVLWRLHAHCSTHETSHTNMYTHTPKPCTHINNKKIKKKI